jgi:hypothetical protein
MQPSFAAVPPVASAPPPFSVGGVIGRTFSTWSRNLVTFVLLSMITTAPNFVFSLWTQYMRFGGYPSFEQMTTVGGPMGIRPGAPPGAYWSVIIAVVIVTFVLMLVQMSALTYGAIQHLAGRRVSMGALVGAGFRRSWPVFATGFVAGLLVLLGFILLVVPGIIVACAVVAAVPAVVAERIGPGEAVKRSFALTKGRRFGIFVAYLVMFLVAWTASMFAGFLPLALGGGTASLVGAFIGFLLTAATTPLWTLFPAVAYHDLRVEKEGVDTTELARVFE